MSAGRWAGAPWRACRACQARDPHTDCLAEDKSDKGTLRPAKSMDSLSASVGASDGEHRRARTASVPWRSQCRPASVCECVCRGVTVL